MTTLAAIPVCDDQLDMLTLIADTQTPIGSLHAADFRWACEKDAAEHDGWVNPNRVSVLLRRAFGEFKPQWFSSMWTGSCGPNGYMTTTDIEAPIDASVSKGNGNKTVKLRRWRSSP